MLPLGRVAVGLPLHLLLPLIVADTDVTSTDASSVLGATLNIILLLMLVLLLVVLLCSTGTIAIVVTTKVIFLPLALHVSVVRARGPLGAV